MQYFVVYKKHFYNYYGLG